MCCSRSGQNQQSKKFLNTSKSGGTVKVNSILTNPYTRCCAAPGHENLADEDGESEYPSDWGSAAEYTRASALLPLCGIS
eukprot:2070744-Amphidinium_carterae.1